MLRDTPICCKPHICPVTFPDHPTCGGLGLKIIIRNDYFGVVIF